MDDKLRTIADHYGLNHQKIKLIEEMAELTQAIIKGDDAHIAEEMCDVELMMEQVRYLGGYHPEAFRPFKINRQLQRIEHRRENG